MATTKVLELIFNNSNEIQFTDLLNDIGSSIYTYFDDELNELKNFKPKKNNLLDRNYYLKIKFSNLPFNKREIFCSITQNKKYIKINISLDSLDYKEKEILSDHIIQILKKYKDNYLFLYNDDYYNEDTDNLTNILVSTFFNSKSLKFIQINNSKGLSDIE